MFVQADALADVLTLVTIDLVAAHADFEPELTVLISGITETVADGTDEARVERSGLALTLEAAATFALVSTDDESEPDEVEVSVVIPGIRILPIVQVFPPSAVTILVCVTPAPEPSVWIKVLSAVSSTIVELTYDCCSTVPLHGEPL